MNENPYTARLVDLGRLRDDIAKTGNPEAIARIEARIRQVCDEFNGDDKPATEEQFSNAGYVVVVKCSILKDLVV